jgi:hypothetical protein
VRAEFFREESPDQVVGAAAWDGRDAVVEPGADPDAAERIGRIFRPVPVVADDPSLRSAGSAGPAVLEPGDVRWFMAAARIRAPSEGLGARVVADDTNRLGWDPAGSYSTFRAAVAPIPSSPSAPD